jgi:hypothetical protein
MSMQPSNEDARAIATPDTVNFTTQERLEFIAQLIAERIAEDKASDYPLLKQLDGTP